MSLFILLFLLWLFYPRMKAFAKAELQEDRRRFGYLLTPFVLILIFLFLATTVRAEQQTFRDSMGRETGRAVTSGNTTTFTDNMGRQTGRSVTNGNTTTVYDSLGRVIRTYGK